MNEAGFIAILCGMLLGGADEPRLDYVGSYDLLGEAQSNHAYIDCETDTHVIEVGLDKRSSLDSLQQAIFASVHTGKQPKIIIIDRDGKVGRWETRIRTAARAVGVEFERISDDALIRTSMTHWMRNYSPAASGSSATRSVAAAD
ncbi:MAG: hypothetical protein AAF841_09920 [Pseudomonadota bacterium]